LHSDINLFDITALPLFFGVAVFDFEGNGIIINLHASMKQPQYFNRVMYVSISLYISLICTFSAIAYYVIYHPTIFRAMDQTWKTW
jgi:amino acid permease